MKEQVDTLKNISHPKAVAIGIDFERTMDEQGWPTHRRWFVECTHKKDSSVSWCENEEQARTIACALAIEDYPRKIEWTSGMEAF